LGAKECRQAEVGIVMSNTDNNNTANNNTDNSNTDSKEH